MKKKEKHFSSDSLNPWTTFSYMSQSISFDYFSKLVFFFNQKNPNTISLCPSLYLTEPQDIEIFFQNHLSIQYLGSWSPASLPITSSQFCFPGLWSPLSHLILISPPHFLTLFFVFLFDCHVDSLAAFLIPNNLSGPVHQPKILESSNLTQLPSSICLFILDFPTLSQILQIWYLFTNFINFQFSSQILFLFYVSVTLF